MLKKKKKRSIGSSGEKNIVGIKVQEINENNKRKQ
jgi:hypothetical protein